MCFSCEFDAYVHIACLEDAMKMDLKDREARIIARELAPQLLKVQ
jgi:hypothetical protein